MAPKHDYTPSARLSKQCQNCMKCESDEIRLLACSGCKRAHYCSTDCQKAHWPAHKALCEMTRNMRQHIKEHSENPAYMSVGAIPLAKVEEVSKKWVQQFRSTLFPTAFVALELRAHPERYLTHYLTVALRPNFTAEKLPVKDKDVRKAFVMENAGVLRWDELNVKSENRRALQILQQSIATTKKKHPSSCGCVVAVLIPDCGIARMVPATFEVLPPPEMESFFSPDWRKVLQDRIAAGDPL